MPVPKSALDLPGLKSSGLTTLAGPGLPAAAASLPGLATTPVTGLAGVALKTTPAVVVPGGLAEPLLIQSSLNPVKYMKIFIVPIKMTSY